jgi:hypothetical protein
MGRAILHDQNDAVRIRSAHGCDGFRDDLAATDWFGRCDIYVICVIATLLAGYAHNNYMLRWIPFFCILLNSPLSRILSLPEKTNTLSCADDERTQPD